jgi:hypothetical protein
MLFFSVINTTWNLRRGRASVSMMLLSDSVITGGVVNAI